MDCDDDDRLAYPGALERCNGKDDDCDGTVDEDTCVEICNDAADNDLDELVDCEDPDCRESDFCVETDCGDGVDDDFDGLVDCMDPDCDGASSCVESDCADGVDNDRDGLVDCEDGDCVDAPSCAEDCTDGVDNDLDGLVDCDDDECWGMACHPDGVRVRVAGGTLQHGTFSWSFASASCSGSTSLSSGRGNSMDASGITGEVRVLPDAATRWSTATTSTACTFSVARASQWWSSTTFGVSSAPLTRSGVTVGSGCRLAGSSFLPWVLEIRQSGIYAGGQRWYNPRFALPLSSYTGSSSGRYSSSCTSGGTSHWSSSSKWLSWSGALESGEQVTVDP